MIYIAWALAEIANVAVFGWLAYYFDKWWIVLFSILTHTSLHVRDEEKGNE